MKIGRRQIGDLIPRPGFMGAFKLKKGAGGGLELPGTMFPHEGTGPAAPILFDPEKIGYDRVVHSGEASISIPTDTLDFSASNSDSIALPKDGIITSIVLVADPYQHDVTTATITVVQDAVDRLISALSITGRPTYFSLSNTPLYLKAVSAQNKKVYAGAVIHGDLATGVGADNTSVQAWVLHFGALNDFDPFDITAGIPAEDEANLSLIATFGASDLIAVTSANGTVDTATDVYAMIFGVQGLSKAYRERLPIPEFQHQHQNSPTSTTSFNLQPSRYLRRSTIVNLAVEASNNQPRNDTNITDLSLIFTKGQRISLFDRFRWDVVRAGLGAWSRGPEVDRDGAAAVAPGGLAGVTQIDWAKLTGNPYGLNLYGYQEGQAVIQATMGTTTGSIHVYHEYYNFADPSVPEKWGGYGGQ
jgi:hypothetical protein